jgi:hypothetical protein
MVFRGYSSRDNAGLKSLSVVLASSRNLPSRHLQSALDLECSTLAGRFDSLTSEPWIQPT